MGGATIVLKTNRNKNFFQDRSIFKNQNALLYLLIIDFPKFDPLTAAGMALCVNLGPKCQNLFSIVSY